jgi:hypothetical protein
VPIADITHQENLLLDSVIGSPKFDQSTTHRTDHTSTDRARELFRREVDDEIDGPAD